MFFFVTFLVLQISIQSQKVDIITQVQLFHRKTHPFSANDANSSKICIFSHQNSPKRCKMTHTESDLSYSFLTGSQNDVFALRMIHFILKKGRIVEEYGGGFSSGTRCMSSKWYYGIWGTTSQQIYKNCNVQLTILLYWCFAIFIFTFSLEE